MALDWDVLEALRLVERVLFFGLLAAGLRADVLRDLLFAAVELFEEEDLVFLVAIGVSGRYQIGSEHLYGADHPAGDGFIIARMV